MELLGLRSSTHASASKVFVGISGLGFEVFGLVLGVLAFKRVVELHVHLLFVLALPPGLVDVVPFVVEVRREELVEVFS